MDLLRRFAIALSLLLGTTLFAACSSGGGGGGNGLSISGTNSTIGVSATTGTLANGTEVVTITVTVRDTGGAVVSGQTVQLASTGTGNTLTQPAATTDVNGIATGTLASSIAETKTVSAIVNPGGSSVAVSTTADTAFVPAVSAANSTITVDEDFGTIADGAAPGPHTIQISLAPFSGVFLNEKLALNESGDTTLTWKDPVRVASTATFDISTLSAGSVVDTVTLLEGDRVLLVAQTDGTENGIYRIQGAGEPAVRSNDASANQEVQAGMACVVTEGAAHEDDIFVLGTPNPIQLGTTPLTFAEFGTGGAAATLSFVTATNESGTAPNSRRLVSSASVQFNDGGAGGTASFNLPSTGVTAAAYTSADITVDAQGRITAASNGTPVNLYSNDGTLSGARAVAFGANDLTFSGSGSFIVNNTTKFLQNTPVVGQVATATAVDGSWTWQTVAAAANLYNTDGALTSVRTVALGVNRLRFTGSADMLFESTGIHAFTGNAQLNGTANRFLQNTPVIGQVATATAIDGSWTWQTVAAAVNLYNTDGSLTANRLVTLGANRLNFAGTGDINFTTTGTFTVSGNSYLTGTANRFLQNTPVIGQVATATAIDGSWTWQTVAAAVNLYNTDGSLTANRVVAMGANRLSFTGTGDILFSSTGTHTFSGNAYLTGTANRFLQNTPAVGDLIVATGIAGQWNWTQLINDQGASGYIVIGTVMVAWGSGSAGTATVFPVAFSAAPSVTALVEGGSSDRILATSAPATTGFTVTSWNTGTNSASSGETFHWIAIGLA